MLALTDGQLAELRTVAKHIPRGLRSVFLQRFAELLRGRADPGDGDVWRALHAAQREIMAGGERVIEVRLERKGASALWS